MIATALVVTCATFATPLARAEVELLAEAAKVPSIVARETWDPGFVAKGEAYPDAAAATYTRIVVHHSDFIDAPGPHGILAYHLEVSGFSDIGYHFVIEPDGVIYQGRPLERMGAHAGATREGARGDSRADPDWGAVGIVLDGYFGDTLPPEPQRTALLSLIAQLRQALPLVREVIGHREVRRGVLANNRHPIGDPTVCPGDMLFSWLEVERALGAFDVRADDADDEAMR